MDNIPTLNTFFLKSSSKQCYDVMSQRNYFQKKFFLFFIIIFWMRQQVEDYSKKDETFKVCILSIYK